MSEINDDSTILLRKMILIGKGQVSTDPDLAILRLGVQTSGESVTEAQNDNARLSQNVIQSLKEAGVSDIQTVQYQIEKLYDYVNGVQVDRGYQVRNLIEVRTESMELIGSMIDTAVAYGANIVESVRFEISNQEIYYQKALNLAVKNAIQKSRSIAISIGSPTDPVPVLITENMLTPIPYSTIPMMREGAVSTPVEPGTLQINATVTIEFVF